MLQKESEAEPNLGNSEGAVKNPSPKHHSQIIGSKTILFTIPIPANYSRPIDRFESAESIDWLHLVDRRDYIDSKTTLEEVQELFKEKPIRYITVLHHDKILGLCSEEKISRLLGLRGGLGFALYSRNPISSHLLQKDYRIIHGSPVNSVLEDVFARPEETFHDDVILQNQNGNYLGLISLRTLTGLQHRIVLNQHQKLEKQILQLESMTNNLNAANEELEQARDEAMAATRMKSAFLANMSHEIRTPMNGVIGMINILLKSELHEQQLRYAKTAKNSAEALLTIINDILDFSKIEAGKMTVESLDFDINEVLEETIELLSERAHSKGIDLFSHVQHDIPSLITGDPTRLRQVLLNLVGNAIKFTEKGEVVVRAIKEGEDEDTVTIKIAVIDTGIGLSEEAQHRLFQPFVQADDSTTRKYGGTGLGLAICKKIIEIMGGEIHVESEIGRGSTFWFTIPFPKPANTVTNRAPNDSTLWGMRLLIVDDSHMFRQLATSLVQSWNMMAMGAASGEEALQILEKQAAAGVPFDIAIVDYQMPGMDGLELSRKMAASHGLSHTKVILLTSYSKSLSRLQLDQANINVMVEKPLKNSELYNALLHVSGRKLISQQLNTPAAKIEPHFQPLHILIVDDSETNQEVALYQLQSLGHSADMACNGQEALEILSHKKYDAILMDGQMPVIDGYETSRKIREATTDVLDHDIYIIAMTANAMQGDREKCLEAGMDDYISKPVVEKDLIAALTRCTTTLAKKVTVQELEGKNRINLSLPSTSTQQPALERSVYFPQKLVDMFISETEKRLHDLDAALQATPQDVALITRMAHTIKGTAGNFKATELEEVCREMEKCGREGNLAQIQTLLPNANDAFGIAINRLLPKEKA